MSNELAKHVPGPWQAGIAPEEPDTILIGAGHTLFCRVVGTPDYPAGPNARLIAAAPDLLEALKSIENDDGSIPETIWAMRNAAIAKAEGKSHAE